MMMNKIPSNTPLNQILTYLESDQRYGGRNRALFALRQHLRIKDIAAMTNGDILNPDGTIRRFYISSIDGARYELDDITRAEIKRYLVYCWGSDLDLMESSDLDVPLFPTQKRSGFSANTLAQHFSALDKHIHGHFTKTGKATFAVSLPERQPTEAEPAKSHSNRSFRKIFSSLSHMVG